MLTYSSLLREYRQSLESMFRPTHVSLLNPEGEEVAKWEIKNSKSIESLPLDEMLSNVTEGWSLTFSANLDPFYQG